MNAADALVVAAILTAALMLAGRALRGSGLSIGVMATMATAWFVIIAVVAAMAAWWQS